MQPSNKGDSSHIFPVPNPTLPYWRSELHEIDDVRTTSELPAECDILIIGAGMSGVSTAYHLLHDNPDPPSIVLLEARQICSGATGRNGGHLMMVPAYVDRVIKSHGIDAARELAVFEQELMYALKRVVETEQLDCDATLTRYSETMLSQVQMDEQRAIYESQVKAGLDFIDDVDLFGPKYAELLSGVKGCKGGLTATALQLWPYKFVSGLLANLIRRTSINVQTRTRVTSIETENGYSWATTPRGSVKARQVVFATNAYTPGIVSKYARKIVPVKGTCSHITKPKDSAAPHLLQTYGLNYAPGVRDYLIPRPDGGVICGGAKNTFGKDKELWYNNFDDSTLIEPARAHFETVMQTNFRGWEDSGATVDYLWTGIMGQTEDGWPHCGKVPNEENHFILAGFCGAGMSHIFLSARGVARMVRDGATFEESGIPRIFKTTEERLKRSVQEPL